jgi:hypothetical protein
LPVRRFGHIQDLVIYNRNVCLLSASDKIRETEMFEDFCFIIEDDYGQRRILIKEIVFSMPLTKFKGMTRYINKFSICPRSKVTIIGNG